MCTLLSVPVMECGTLTLSLVWTVLSLLTQVRYNPSPGNIYHKWTRSFMKDKQFSEVNVSLPAV